jgi:mRNA-degrading endonuclease toxin of MazEF toxin-antitoxin module
VPDPNGLAKRRPLAVITSDDEIAAAPRVAAVAVTTTFRDPPPPDRFALPWDPPDRSATGLRRKSFAVCGWVVAVAKEDVQAEQSHVPPAVLLQILAKLPKP